MNWPKELTPELRDVLGMPNFRCGLIAHIHRAAGVEITPRSEDEQAFIIHWLVGIVFEHGADWRKIASEQLKALVASVEAKERGPTAPPL